MPGRTRSGRRPDYEWVDVCGAISSLDLAISTGGLGTVSFSLLGSGTLMRLRGRVGIQLDATAVDERALVALGIIKVKTTAVTAGLASVPTPFTEAEADWIWYGYSWVSSGAEAAVVDTGLFDRLTIDSKAMRKFTVADSLIFCAEICTTSDMGGSVDIQYGFRALLAS